MTDLNNLDNFKYLTDPVKLQDQIQINDLSIEQAKEAYERMCLIRKAENKLAIARRDGDVGGPVHLGVGQEAIAVGVSLNLKKSDRIFGAHRSHSHLLAMGSSVRGLFAETLGKDTGASKGMGGSMHLWDQSNGFYGSVPIVAGTVSLAVGAGFAAKLQRKDDVSVAYFGDGAIEEGVVHESLNLARVLKAPTLFVLENNLFSSHMHISQRQPKDITARFAQANDIPYHIIDGNDIAAVIKASADLLEHARSGNGPVFLEAITFRWYGHVDWREDIDVGVNRSKEEVKNWRARDPVARLREAMLSAQIWSNENEEEMNKRLDDEVNSAWVQAMNAPYPSSDALLERVYA